MFIGEYTHTIDEKGRLAIPVKFRKDLIKGAVITRGLDNCLFLYPIEEWKVLAEKLSKLPIGQANTRAFARLMLAGAMDATLDKQGRVIIPDYLRKFGKISKKIVLAGLYNRIEVWGENEWEKFKGSAEKSSNDIAEKLGEIV